RELWLLGTGGKGGVQKATAIGPGRIDLVDRASPAPRHPQHAFWRDKLISVKEGVNDLLTLTGDAVFIDEDHDQKLQAQRIQVLLEPAELPPTPVAKEAPAQGPGASTAADTPRQRPKQLEAFENVVAHSPEMDVHDAEHLTLY